MYRKLIPNPLVFQGGLLQEDFFELENLSEHDKIILGLYIEQGFIININSVEETLTAEETESKKAKK